MNKKIDIEKIKDQILNCNSLEIPVPTVQKTDNKPISIQPREQASATQSDFEIEYKQFIYEQQLISKVLEMLKPYINDYIDSKIDALNKPKSKRMSKK